MRNPDRNPYASYAPRLAAENPAGSPMGRALRRGDARLRLQEMAAAEEDVCREEAAVDAIDNRLARMQAAHALNMQYLIRFGVTATEREAFRRTLEEVAETGRLNLREAAHVARLRHAADGADAAVAS